MLCQRCNKNTATTLFTQTLNGHTQSEQLCSSCAMSAQQAGMGNWLQEFPFNSFFTNMLQSQVIEHKRCPSCGCSFEEIAETGKIGCADCYSVFKTELAPTIQRIHGKAEHIGKYPHSYHKVKTERIEETEPEHIQEAQTASISEIDLLKQKLKTAVEAQDFEEAARYRDEIKRLEQNS